MGRKPAADRFAVKQVASSVDGESAIAVTLERIVVERLTLELGGTYEIEARSKWGSGRRAHVVTLNEDGATCNVEKVGPRNAFNAFKPAESVGMFTIPYSAFVREWA